MVENNLLVVKTTNRHENVRYDIHQVHQELASMLNRPDINDYAIRPVPL